MKPILVQFIPQSSQKYPTAGNYFEDKTFVHFEITEYPGKPMYSVAILLHEIWEFYRNQQEGISVEEVDEFDLSHPELDDPGLSKDAPYHKTHMEADAVERMFICAAGEDWVDYEEAIDKEMAKCP